MRRALVVALLPIAALSVATPASASSWVDTELRPSLERVEQAAERVKQVKRQFHETITQITVPSNSITERGRELGVVRPVTPYWIATSTECGPYIGTNAFYCHGGGIYVDVELARSGPEVLDFVLLHEDAHARDYDAGRLHADTDRGDELRADCVAGRGLRARGIPVKPALSWLRAHGGGDPNGHGTAAQRVSATLNGYQGGAC